MIKRVKKLIDRALSRWYVTHAQLKEEMVAMEHAYRVLADARAQQAMQHAVESQLYRTNEDLIGALTASRGAQWAGAEKPNTQII